MDLLIVAASTFICYTQKDRKTDRRTTQAVSKLRLQD